MRESAIEKTHNIFNKICSVVANIPLLNNILEELGRYAIFVRDIWVRSMSPRLSFQLLFQQMDFVGNKSVFIIILAAFLVGAIFGFQLGYIFRIFGTEAMIGAASGVALAREMAPVFGAFLVTGRAGSAMAAEIGSMRVNEQIDALKVMAVNPINYLVAPRVWASVLMMPLLCILFVAVGMFASMVVAETFFNVDPNIFFDKVALICKPSDMWIGVYKSCVFGFIFSVVGCYTGYHATGGAEGVGKATTKAVVISLVLILIGDLILSYLLFDPNEQLIK